MSRPLENLSGIAATVGGPGTELTPRPDLAQIATAAQAIKSQQQQDAQSKLRMALELINDHGIIPEQKDFDQMLEGVGFSPEIIDNIHQGVPVPEGTPLPEGIAPADITKVGNAIQGSNAGAQAANPPSEQAARRAPGGGVTQTVPEGTGTVESAVTDARGAAENLGAIAPVAEQPVAGTVQTVRQLRARGGLDALSKRALDRIDREVTSQEQAADLSTLVHNLTVQAGSADPAVAAQAEGRLMRMGGLSWTQARAQWNLMTDADKATSIELALGNETPAQRVNRESNIGMNLMNSGRFKSFNDAMRAARGETVQMLSDPERMIQEAEFYGILRDIGFNDQQAKVTAIQLGNGVPIGDALPEGIRSVVEQEIEFRQFALTLDEAQVRQLQERLDLDWWRAQKDASLAEAALLLEAGSGDNDDLFDRIDAMVLMHREGLDVSQDVMDALVNETARRTQLVPERVNSMLNHLGFGDRFTYTPFISEEQAGMAESAAGASQQPSDELLQAAEGISIFSRQRPAPDPNSPEGRRALANASKQRIREEEEARKAAERAEREQPGFGSRRRGQ